jgi:DNA modification methylase
MIITGDCLEILPTLEPESVQCCVTSPPYWGLRDYGAATWEGGDSGCDHKKPAGGGHGEASPIGKGERDIEIMTSQRYFNVCRKCGAVRTDNQIGLESTPEAYVEKMVQVFREVRRVLRDDGTLWLNLGSSYAGSWGDSGHRPERDGVAGHQREKNTEFFNREGHPQGNKPVNCSPPGFKPKDMVPIPWMVAMALQADGWYLRQDIIWNKPNPMPESVTDRCTKSHEYIFLLTKSARYFYDAEAVKEQSHYPEGSWGRSKCYDGDKTGKLRSFYGNGSQWMGTETRNRRSVWTITTKPFKEAHFATFPPEIPEICIKAGTSEKGCCLECGSPWGRVVEKEGAVKNINLVNTKQINVQQGGKFSSTLNATPPLSVTVGWRPTCTHNLEPIPCTILDPFAGANTTGMVAERLGRKCISIELNPAYCEMGERREEAVRLPLFP